VRQKEAAVDNAFWGLMDKGWPGRISNSDCSDRKHGLSWVEAGVVVVVVVVVVKRS
jgi:hypothetical protein